MAEINGKWERLCKQVEDKGYSGKGFVEEMIALYESFQPSFAEWLGGLYDPPSGGFYYSNSARENGSFLPDLESTYCAIALMSDTGFIHGARELPEDMQEGIARFVRSLQSAEDGYFHHPQWQALTDWREREERLGRDLNRAVTLANELEFDLEYLTANERELLSGSFVDEAPEFLSTPEALTEYLSGLDWEDDARGAARELGGHAREIFSSGLAATAALVLGGLQKEESGFFGGGTGVEGLAATLDICRAYTKLSRPIPHPERIAVSAVELLCSDYDRDTACADDLYTIWFTLFYLVGNIRRYGGDGLKGSDPIVCAVLQRGEECIRRTRERLEAFRKPDGSYSYYPTSTLTERQGAPVAVKGIDEGDVLSTALCVQHIPTAIFMALGLTMPEAFCHGDFKRFIGAIKKVGN